MTQEDFDKLVERRKAAIDRVLQAKGEEYASGNDRLYNFKRAAQFTRETPVEALIGMLAKHLVCVLDVAVPARPGLTAEQWEEKITDTINYLILLDALVVEGLGRASARVVALGKPMEHGYPLRAAK